VVDVCSDQRERTRRTDAGRSPQQPDGVRYRLALILAGDRGPTILYDNHHPKGHHRHIGGTERPYEFVDVARLVADFLADVQRLIGAEQ